MASKKVCLVVIIFICINCTSVHPEIAQWIHPSSAEAYTFVQNTMT